MNDSLYFNVTAKDIQKSISYFEDNVSYDYFLVNDNLFSIDKIVTLFNPEIMTNDLGENVKESFLVSYDDPNFKVILSIDFKYENESCINFLNVSKLLNESQVGEIGAKIVEYKQNAQGKTDDELKKAIDEIAFNEALSIMMHGSNKEDCDAIKNDLTSRYEKWKATITERNKEGHDLLNNFYEIILNIKSHR